MQFLCSTATFLCTSESNKHQTSWLIYFIWELCICEISSDGIKPKSKSYVPNPSPNSKSKASHPKSKDIWKQYRFGNWRLEVTTTVEHEPTDK